MEREHPKPYVWVKTADEILAAMARYCDTNLRCRRSSGVGGFVGTIDMGPISNSGH